MHIHTGAHIGGFCPHLFLLQGSEWLLLHGAVCERFAAESKFGCLSEPVGSGSRTRFQLRASWALSIFSSAMRAEQGFSSACAELVLEAPGGWVGGGSGAEIEHGGEHSACCVGRLLQEGRALLSEVILGAAFMNNAQCKCQQANSLSWLPSSTHVRAVCDCPGHAAGFESRAAHGAVESLINVHGQLSSSLQVLVFCLTEVLQHLPAVLYNHKAAGVGQFPPLPLTLLCLCRSLKLLFLGSIMRRSLA